MSWGLVEFRTGGRPRAAVAGDEAGGCAATAGATAPPWTVIAVGSLCSVTYCSFAGSKYENASTGRLCLFSLGETTISNVFVPLIPTSSSCLNFEDGGYLCQPRSSSSTGAFTRSKFPRPEIVAVTVIGSPTWTLFGFASTAMVKLPTAPEKFGGAFAGSGFTFSAAVSLRIGSSVRSPMLPNGSLKNGSENGSSISKRSNGERG